MCGMVCKLVLILTLVTYSFHSWAGLTAEQVLGEYWKDPLFGEAATEQTYSVELLVGRVLPELLAIPKSTNIRLVFLNHTSEPHLIAITKDPASLLVDEAFVKFVEDELYHSQQTVVSGRGHSHSGTSVNNAESMIKTLDQRPTVFVKSKDRKEILLRFDQAETLSFFCALPGHESRLHGEIIINIQK